ncbi:hypothetical protein ACFOET_11200, partial [Parapedobacter deserti]
MKDQDGDGDIEECSYGKRLAPINYATFDKLVTCGVDQVGNAVETASQSFVLYSESSILNNEPIVGYDKVTVYTQSKELNGYTEYEYNNTISASPNFANGSFNARPAGIPNLIRLGNGLLIKHIDYVHETSTNLFRKAKETINNYASLPTITHVGLRLMRSLSGSCVSYAGKGVSYLQYPAFQSSWNQLSSQTVVEYPLVNEGFSTTTEYVYEQGEPEHYLPIQTKVLGSDGSITSSILVYPTDYANASGAIYEMQQKNLLLPIERVQYKEVGTTRTILSGSITTYKPGGQGLVDQVLELETVSPVPLASFKFSNRSTAGQLPPSAGGPANYSADTRYKP